MVLLIACANVASLLLSRAAARQKEIAVRLSIGGARARLVRQLLTESVLLAGAGGLLGLIFANWGIHALIFLIGSRGERLWLDFLPDPTVLAFTAGVSLLTGILFGLAPALESTRVDLLPVLNASAGGGAWVGKRARLRFGKGLVIAQVALSLVLLIGAGLFVRTLENLMHQNLGFNQHNLLLFGIDATQIGYKGERLGGLYDRLLSGVQNLPGVVSASMSRITLVSGSRMSGTTSIEGYQPERGDEMDIDWNAVGPGFFETMRIRVLLGRGIERRDSAGSPKVAVINESMARKYFAGQNPTGHRLSLGMPYRPPGYEIVGVVADTKYDSLRKAPQPTYYLALSQVPEPPVPMHFEVRAAGDPLALVPAVRRVAQDLEPHLPLINVITQTDQIEEMLEQERAFSLLSSFFGGLAVLLASVGLYGLMAHSVSRRTNEIGIRMALGAEKGDVLGMVLRETLALVAVGVAAGLPLAFAALRLISGMLYGLSPTDPLTIAGSTLLAAGVAGLAGYLPARRATKVDPIVALRYE